MAGGAVLRGRSRIVFYARGRRSRIFRPVPEAFARSSSRRACGDPGGAPSTRELRAPACPLVTKAPAPTIDCAPITAPFQDGGLHDDSGTSSPISQAWIMAALPDWFA